MLYVQSNEIYSALGLAYHIVAFDDYLHLQVDL